MPKVSKVVFFTYVAAHAGESERCLRLLSHLKVQTKMLYKSPTGEYAVQRRMHMYGQLTPCHALLHISLADLCSEAEGAKQAPAKQRGRQKAPAKQRGRQKAPEQPGMAAKRSKF